MNGSGKSTLLKVIGGVEKAESGQIETQKGLQVVYVDQEPSFPSGTKVEDVMFDPKVRICACFYPRKNVMRSLPLLA